jgi:hypothetical protein
MYFSKLHVLLNNYCNWPRKNYFWPDPCAVDMYCQLWKRVHWIWMRLGLPASIWKWPYFCRPFWITFEIRFYYLWPIVDEMFLMHRSTICDWFQSVWIVRHGEPWMFQFPWQYHFPTFWSVSADWKNYIITSNILYWIHIDHWFLWKFCFRWDNASNVTNSENIDFLHDFIWNTTPKRLFLSTEWSNVLVCSI